MSSELQADLKAELQAIPWFADLSEAHFDRFVAMSRLRSVDPGEELFREGDQQDFIYIVINGRVALEIFVPGRGRQRILSVEPLELFGWSSVTPVVRQRTASARAVLPSRLLAIDAQRLRQACEQDHDLGYVVMRRLANVVAARLLVTRLQMMDMFAGPNVEEPL